MNVTAAAPLSLGWRLAILGIVVVQFVVGHGAIWRRSFDWDRSIVWSYATIPVLVLVALIIRKRARIVTWFLHTLEIAAAKFAITAAILMALLIARYGNEPIAASPRSAAPVVSHGSPAAQPAVAGERGSSSPISISVGERFSPAVAVARVGQPILVNSSDGRLHSANVQRSDGTRIVNVSVLGSGEPTVLPIGDGAADGVVVVGCAVHGEREGSTTLLFAAAVSATEGEERDGEGDAEPGQPAR
jgi:hypothetical protein